MSDAPKFDPSKVDHKAVQELDDAFAKAAAKKKLESKQKKVDEQIDQANAFFKSLFSLGKLWDKDLKLASQEERQKVLEEALTGMVGALIGEGGDDLSEAVKTLVDIWRAKLTEDEKKKALEDAISKLLATVGAAAIGAKEKDKKSIGQLVGYVVILFKLASGQLTDDERQKILEDSLFKLMTADLVKRQLEWFISESFLTYVQAVKLGYQFGKPFGDHIKAQLDTIANVSLWQKFVVALESEHGDWLSEATSGTVTVTLHGSWEGWKGTAFLDPRSNGVRIYVQKPNNEGTALLDPSGVDVTTESVSSPSDPTESIEKPSDATIDAENHVEDAVRVGNSKGGTELKAKAERIRLEADAFEERSIHSMDPAERQRLHLEFVVRFSEYWHARDVWKAHMRKWLLAAAAAQQWGQAELYYLWSKDDYRPFAIHTWELTWHGAGPLPAVGGVKYMPVAVGRAGLYALIAAIVLALLGSIGVFAMTRPASAPQEFAATAQPSGTAPAKAANQPPRITLFRATFARPTTTYAVEATDPDGDALTFAWAFTTNCGTTSGGNATTATWSHPDRSIGGNCPDEAVHPGAIAVTVSDGKGGSASYTWTRGSDVGEVRP